MAAKRAQSTSPKKGGRPPSSTVAKRITVGLDEKEVPRFDTYKAHLKSQLQGAAIADTAIAKILMIKGLEAFEKEEAAKAQPQLPLTEALTTTTKP